MNKIILGSAQLIKNYGISNSKITTEQNFFKLLDNCVKRGIKIIDTSDSYENAHEIIGKYKKYKFEIITKYYFKNKMNKNYYEKIIKKNIANTKAAIGYHNLHAVLIHNIHQIDKNSLSIISNLLIKMKKKHLINKIGISIYNKEDLQKITNLKLIDILQVPINLINQSFCNKKFLEKINKKKIEIHARSIFLQGILLSSNLHNLEYFKKWKNLWNRYYSWLHENKVSQLTACLTFIKRIKNISGFVVGIENETQFKEILNCRIKKKLKFNKFLNQKNKKLTDPSKWHLQTKRII